MLLGWRPFLRGWGPSLFHRKLSQIFAAQEPSLKRCRLSSPGLHMLLPHCGAFQPQLFENFDPCPGVLGAPNRGVFLSLYGGSSRVAKSWQEMGREAIVLDTAHNAANDLGTSEAHDTIIRMLQATDPDGKALVGLLGVELPCNTWSLCRGRGRGPPRLRDLRHIDGLPGLVPKNLEKVAQANAQIKNAVAWIRCSCAQGVPGYLENGRRSLIWHHPLVLELIQEGLCWVSVLDQCQYETEYRKRTLLLVWGVPENAFDFLRCRAPRGICSRTGLAHLHLEGVDQNGRFKTAAAQVYPVKMAQAIAMKFAGH